MASGKPWDIFRQSAGCLILFVAFCAGTILGYVFFWFDDHSREYIDRSTAIRYAIDNARDICARENYPRKVDCRFNLVKTRSENKDGWFFVL